LDMPRISVAIVLSDSPNQFWLTCIIQDISALH
jgi:hypothetical protein